MRKEWIWRTARGICSMGSFQGKMLTRLSAAAYFRDGEHRSGALRFLRVLLARRDYLSMFGGGHDAQDWMTV